MCFNLSLHAIELRNKTDLLGTPLQAFVSKHAGRSGQKFRTVVTDALVPQGPLTRALSTGAAVSSFTLINADTNAPISGYENLASGVTLNLATLPTKNLNVLANTTGTGIGSVKFQLDSNSSYRVENTSPYALAGDSGTGDYYAWTPTLGSHTLGATVYSGASAGGTAGGKTTIIFSVINSTGGGGSTTQAPYPGTAVSAPGLIEAENYDTGGEGVAYHDLDSSNLGGAYRNDGVDVEPTTDTGGGYNVGHIRAGEWLEYTINVPNSGTFNLDARVGSGGPGGTFHVEIDGTDKTGSMNLPFTGSDWKTWTTVTKTGVSLTAGTHVMRVVFDTSANGGDIGNINSVRFSTNSTVTTAIAWSAKKRAPLARDEATGVAIGGKLYVFGGFYGSNFAATTRVDVYDTATDTWSAKRNMPEALTHSPAVYDGQYVWLAGGYVGNDPGPATNHVWRYDPASDSWAAAAALPAARGGGASALVGRELHYFGGRNLNRTTDQPEHWVLNLDNVAAGWMEKASMLAPRNHLAGIALNGKVYAIGGQTGETTSAVDKTQVDVYDPATDAWSRVADLPGPRSHAMATTFIRNGRIMMIGGESAHNAAQSNVWGYDPGANQWITYTSLPAKRRAAVAALVNDKIIVTGGYDGFVHNDETWAGI